MPTIAHILAEEYEEFVLANNNTEAKQLQSLLKQIRSMKFVLMLIGIMQVLEIYTAASLAVQHSTWFPTMVWAKVKQAKESIHILGQNFAWEERKLEIAGIGSPQQHMKNLRKGLYKPYVPLKSPRSNQTNEETLGFGRSSTDDLFDEESHFAMELAGELSLEGEFEVEEPKVVESLTKICNSLVKRWDERHKETERERVMNETLGSPHDMSGYSENQKFEYFYGQVDKLLSVLPEEQRQQFDQYDSAAGFAVWNKYFQVHSNEQINVVWKNWIKSLSSENKQEYSMFIDLFQNFQVRVMSFAMCETIGSLMNAHGSKGRCLQPNNFNTEMCLKFNLGPLHTLDDFIEEIYQMRKKEYIRKLDTTRLDKLVSVHSAANRTYRQKQEEKAKLPLDLWKHL